MQNKHKAQNLNPLRLLEFVVTEANRPTTSADGKRLGLFRSHAGVLFADIYNGPARQSLPMRSRQFVGWISAKYCEAAKRCPSQSELNSVITLIDQGGLRELSTNDVFIRVGQFQNRLYLDLADETCRAVEIDATGWRLVQSPPARFFRAPGMKRLPVPQEGGSIGMLRSLVNLRDDDDFVLLIAWLVGALRQSIPKPILSIRGGEGSAKSSLVEIVRRLIDPYDPIYATLPRNETQLQAIATTAYCHAFDNVSSLSRQMSDSLCQFVTGGGNQPLILSGLFSLVTRPDLADRCLFIHCDPIPNSSRRTRRDVMAEFEKKRGYILGALLDGVVQGLKVEEGLNSISLPRMADFAHWATACEPALWSPCVFRTAYDRNRADAVETLLGSDPVMLSVRQLLHRHNPWEGSASDLDSLLRAMSGSIDVKTWPAEPRLLANRLRDVAPALMKTGISIAFHRSSDRERTRLIRIKFNDQELAENAAARVETSTSAAFSNATGLEAAASDHDAAAGTPMVTSNPDAADADAADHKQSICVIEDVPPHQMPPPVP